MRTLIHITTMMITLGMVACSAGPTGDDTAEENLPVVANPVAEAIQDSKDSGLTVRELCVYNDQLIWLTWDEETILIYKDEEQVSAPIRFEILAHWGYEFQVTEQGIFQIREIAYGGHDSIIFADPFGETLVFKGLREGHEEQWRILWDGKALDGNSACKTAFFCQEMVVQRFFAADGNVAGFNYACDTEYMVTLPGPGVEISNKPDQPPWALQHLTAKP